MGEQHRLRVLQVGAAGHDGGRVRRGLRGDRVDQLDDPVADRVRVVEQVHPDEGGDLVVAAAARAQPASELGADRLDERAFERAVHVLVRRRGHELAGLDAPGDDIQPLVHRGLVVRRQEPGRRERLGVRVRPGDVVEGELPVEVGRPRERGELGRRAVGEPCRPRDRQPWLAHLRVPPRADLRRQRPELDEALRQRLVERVAGVVGRQREVVQALRALPAGDRRPSALQREADVAGHVLLRVVDERVEAALESRVPEAVVDQPGPLGLDAALVAVDVALEGEVLELLVGGDQGEGGRSLVDLAALDADETVLDDVDAADAVLAGEHVELLRPPAAA